jgi:hypothetical protein
MICSTLCVRPCPSESLFVISLLLALRPKPVHVHSQRGGNSSASPPTGVRSTASRIFCAAYQVVHGLDGPAPGGESACDPALQGDVGECCLDRNLPDGRCPRCHCGIRLAIRHVYPARFGNEHQRFTDANLPRSSAVSWESRTRPACRSEADQPAVVDVILRQRRAVAFDQECLVRLCTFQCSVAPNADEKVGDLLTDYAGTHSVSPLGSKATHRVPLSIDSPTKMESRQTLMYFHEFVGREHAGAPTRGLPRLGNARSALSFVLDGDVSWIPPHPGPGVDRPDRKVGMLYFECKGGQYFPGSLGTASRHEARPNVRSQPSRDESGAVPDPA